MSFAMRAKALAGLSALSGVALVTAMAATIVAQLMDHFGVSYQDGLLIVALIAAGSFVLFWMFPWLLPVIGTVRLLLFYFGTGVVVGW